MLITYESMLTPKEKNSRMLIPKEKNSRGPVTSATDLYIFNARPT